MSKKALIIIISSLVVIALVAGIVLLVVNRRKGPAQSSTWVEDNDVYVADVNNSPEVGNDATGSNSTNTASGELAIRENDGCYDDDLALGLEVRDVKANGHSVNVKVETYGDSKKQANGPYYIDYRVYVGQERLESVFEGKYHLEGYGIEILKTFDMEEDAGTNCEFFEYDFKVATYKGEDEEYVAITIPAGTEDKNQSSFILATDEGKLVADWTCDVVKDITLTGPNADLYKNYSGDYVFNSIKDGVITYLTPTEAMYKKDASGKKVLDTTLEELELEEHSVTVKDGKVTDKKTENVYKITNAKGKEFDFGEFRH